MERRKKILIVEDDVKSRFALESVLQQRGFDVVAMETAEAAAKVDGHPFDAAVIDIRLPRQQGNEFGMEFKKKHPNTRIIFVTAYHEDVGWSVPGSVLLIKPIEMDVLCKLL